VRMSDLKAGWDIVGNDGGHLGQIREVGQNYVLVSTGRMSEPLYVPASAIANVERDVVHLNVSEREAGAMGWEQPPREEDAPTTDEADLHRHI
jgi:hypothetical protein